MDRTHRHEAEARTQSSLVVQTTRLSEVMRGMAGVRTVFAPLNCLALDMDGLTSRECCEQAYGLMTLLRSFFRAVALCYATLCCFVHAVDKSTSCVWLWVFHLLSSHPLPSQPLQLVHIPVTCDMLPTLHPRWILAIREVPYSLPSFTRRRSACGHYRPHRLWVASGSKGHGVSNGV